MIVHGRRSSSNVQAVMWVAGELGLSINRLDVGGEFGGTNTAAFRAMNPMGLVPVLQDGETILFESATITRYLLRIYGPDPFTTAPHCDVWAEWAKHTFAEAFTVPIFWAFYRTPTNKRDMTKVIAALRHFEKLAAIAMEQRADRSWIAGDEFSLADIWAGHVLHRYFTLDLPRHPPSSLEAYFEALQERPAYRTHVMIDYSELHGSLIG